jgi:diguanylate cyclase (GGDEF)-like protein
MARLRVLAVIVCGLWALFAPAWAFADAPFALSRIGDSAASPAEVVSGTRDATAVALPRPVFTPAPPAGLWLRVKLLADLEHGQPQALVIDAPNRTTVSTWLPGAADPVIRSTNGEHADPGFSPRLAVFRLPESLRSGQSIYVHIQSTARYPDTVRIVDAQALQIADRVNLQANTLIVGTLLALTLVGIGMGLMLRETDFLLLGFGLAFALFFLLDNTSDLYRIPGFEWLSTVEITQHVVATCAAILMAWFALRYLQMAQRTPVLARMQWCVIAIHVTVLIAYCIPATTDWRMLPRIGNFTSLFSAFIDFASATKGAIAGHRASRMFLWSWAPLLFCLGWKVVEISKGWQANPVLQFAFPASFVIAGVLMMIGLGDRMLKYKRERDASDLLARRDPLTDIYNRRALDERLHAAALQTGQASQPLALLFIDLDHFKRINDEYGHDVGDECLREVARRIRSTLRYGDVVGRYGGEEFVVGLPHTAVGDASAMGERIRHAVGSQPIRCGGLDIGITISIGVAVLDDGLAGFDAAIKRADRALYASKRDGRDRVSVLAS